MKLTEWLEELNKEFQKDDIKQRDRPWKAIHQYARDFRVPVTFPSDITEKILEYFNSRSKPGTFESGSLYESVYFYDSQFWPVSIPVFYGKVKLDAFQSLYSMPPGLRREMISDEKKVLDYRTFWCDCFNYALGIEDIRKDPEATLFGKELLLAGDQKLRNAALILSQSIPGTQAIFECRMAVEMFFKACIAMNKELTDQGAKHIGHDLGKGLIEFLKILEKPSWEKLLRDRLSVFPQIHDRYKPQATSLKDLWAGFSTAQFLGSTVIRKYSTSGETY